LAATMQQDTPTVTKEPQHAVISTRLSRWKHG
jgi:hypothetical protein